MSTIANIALRNLTRQKKRTILLASAIAFGVMIVTIINGFAGAFSGNVAENFSDLIGGHIFIEGKEKTSNKNPITVIRNDSSISRAIEASEAPVKFIAKRSSMSGTLVFEGKKIMAQISGVDINHESYLKDRVLLKEGSWDELKKEHGLILSEKIANRLNLNIGDTLLVQMETVNGQNNVGEFSLAGISYNTSIFNQMVSYANLHYVNSLIGLAPEEYQTIGIMLDKLKSTDFSAEAIYAELQKSGVQLFEREASDDKGAETPFHALIKNQRKENWYGVKYSLFTINDMLSQIKQIVAALDTTAAVILVILFIIIMVGITNTFSMVMFERIGEIGTLRALGLQRGGVRNMFSYEALFLALGGALFGIILAMIIMAMLSLINFGMENPAFIVMKNGHLSFFLPHLRALFNIGIIALLTLIAVAGPASKAARLSPAEALRTTK